MVVRITLMRTTIAIAMPTMALVERLDLWLLSPPNMTAVVVVGPTPDVLKGDVDSVVEASGFVLFAVQS